MALLIDILEAALPAEAISGVRTSNPPLSAFFNTVYGQLIDTARSAWRQGGEGRSRRSARPKLA